MNYLSLNAAENIIKSSGTRICGVTFVKKTDGNERKMTCRLGCKKNVKGIEFNRKIQDKDNNVLTVFDMRLKDFRRINLEQVKRIRACGKEYTL